MNHSRTSIFFTSIQSVRVNKAGKMASTGINRRPSGWKKWLFYDRPYSINSLKMLAQEEKKTQPNNKSTNKIKQKFHLFVDRCYDSEELAGIWSS